MARSWGSVCDEIYLGGFHLEGKILSVSVEGVWCNVLCDYGWVAWQVSRGMTWMVSWNVTGIFGGFFYMVEWLVYNKISGR